METKRERRWQIGDLAKQTGLSVRALRHYDELGLLRPSERSEAGYRLYAEADVRRLYRIVALRQLDFPLEEIASLLDQGEPRWSGCAPRSRQCFSLATPTASVLRGWLQDAGFGRVDAYGAHGEPLGVDSRRLVVVAER